MRIIKLHLNDFRGIHQMTLEFGPRINVLAGVNGAGKSSILNALAILLSRFIWRISTRTRTGRIFLENDVRIGATHTTNTIWIDYEGKLLEWTAGKSR